MFSLGIYSIFSYDLTYKILIAILLIPILYTLYYIISRIRNFIYDEQVDEENPALHTERAIFLAGDLTVFFFVILIPAILISVVIFLGNKDRHNEKMVNEIEEHYNIDVTDVHAKTLDFDRQLSNTITSHCNARRFFSSVENGWRLDRNTVSCFDELVPQAIPKDDLSPQR